MLESYPRLNLLVALMQTHCTHLLFHMVVANIFPELKIAPTIFSNNSRRKGEPTDLTKLIHNTTVLENINEEYL